MSDVDIEARFIEQECEGGCQLATIRAENALLRAALLWMRNHCDVGKPELRELALARADAVLKDCEPSLAGMAYFRARYPVLETQPPTAAPAQLPSQSWQNDQIDLGRESPTAHCGGLSART